MTRLNVNQARHLLATFRYVDALFERVARLAEPGDSSFAAEDSDIGPEEAQRLRVHAELLRGRMVEALADLGIAVPPRTQSSRWAAEMSLRMADISLSELGWHSLRKGGPVDEATAHQVTALSTELREMVARAMQVLHEGDVGDDNTAPDHAMRDRARDVR